MRNAVLAGTSRPGADCDDTRGADRAGSQGDDRGAPIARGADPADPAGPQRDDTQGEHRRGDDAGLHSTRPATERDDGLHFPT